MAKLPSLCLAGLLLAAPLTAADTLSVKRVVDGDTLALSNGEKVRLIGIDTPEYHSSNKLKKDAERQKRDKKVIQALGKRSSNFVKGLMQGRKVRLEYEKPNRTSGHKDRYDRTLAYVYFDPPSCDELEHTLAEEVCELDSFEKGFLNALIIEAGYANAYTNYPFKHMDSFRKLEREARQHQRGLWKDDGLRLTWGLFSLN